MLKIYFFGKCLALWTQNVPVYLNHILNFFSLTEYISLCQRPSEFQCSLSTCTHAKLLQLCPTLCSPMVCSHQAPLSMGFSRQECWSGLPFPPPGFPTQGSNTRLFTSSALAGRFFTTSTTWEALSLSKTSLSLEAQHTDKRKQCLKGKELVAQSCSTLWPHGL